MKKQNYIFLGPPGCGKGTQAKKIAKDFNLIYFGAGDLLREEAEKGTETGKIFQEVWDRGNGEIIKEEIVQDFFEEKIKEIGLGKIFVFDGFPRTVFQAHLLENFFSSVETPFLVININVSSQNLIERMETRRVCESCNKTFFQAEKMGIKQCTFCGGKLIRRQEDAPEIIQKRIEVYEAKTKPLIDYYKEKGILVDIDGEPPIEEVTKEILEVINE